MLALYMSFIDDESQRRLFEEIYLNYRKQMLLVARSVLGSDTDAEDVVHDVFLKIAKKHMSRISKIENRIDLRNYLLKATKNTALDHLRKRRHEEAILDTVNEKNLKKDAKMADDELVDKICSGIEYERVVTAIASMDGIYQEALYYHFVLEMSVPEVAKLLDCKVSTVKQRLVRGKKLLHKQRLLQSLFHTHPDCPLRNLCHTIRCALHKVRLRTPSYKAHFRQILQAKPLPPSK